MIIPWYASHTHNNPAIGIRLTTPLLECWHRDLYTSWVSAHRIWLRRTAPGHPRQAYQVLLACFQYVVRYLDDDDKVLTYNYSPNGQFVSGTALRQAAIFKACTRLLDRVRGSILLGDRTGV